MERTPHCAKHESFHEGCPVCVRARANHQPYPVQKQKPTEKRSFGMSGVITEESLRAEETRFRYGNGLEVGQVSGWVWRIVRRLLWPF